MATFESSQTTNIAASASVVLTKPTGLAVGDVLVAHLGNAATSGSPGSFTLPADWTSVLNTVSTGVTSNLVRMQIMTKTADSADVAASNFTFTVSGHAGFTGGGLTRLSNTGVLSGNASTTQNDSTGSPIVFSGFTPTRSGNLMMMFAFTYATSGGIGAYSGYSVTTDNPTWTERYDLNNGTQRAALAMATGSRTGANATGNASITASLPTDADTIVALLAFSDIVNGSTSPATEVNAYTFSPITSTQVEAVVASPDITVTSPTNWQSETKPSTNWTNEI